MKFERIKTEILFEGRAFDIRRDHLKTPSGRIAKYDIVEHHGSVVLVPVDEAGNIHFVRQYRHASGMELLELPAGTLEPGEEPIACAGRELREEIGMAASHLREIGSFYLVPGYSTEYMHVFLATGLQENPLPPDLDEYLSVEKMPSGKALEMAHNGQIPDAKSLAALLLAQKYL
ncbi:MAG: NUDIX hydrolase [Anaerolineales bacterium]|jgi:ADP-ribose pyrophosphatase|nr:NUDIX hydrolase [Anaerolineales bacterium]